MLEVPAAESQAATKLALFQLSAEDVRNREQISTHRGRRPPPSGEVFFNPPQINAAASWWTKNGVNAPAEGAKELALAIHRREWSTNLGVVTLQMNRNPNSRRDPASSAVAAIGRT
jgi:hypothetical protein